MLLSYKDTLSFGAGESIWKLFLNLQNTKVIAYETSRIVDTHITYWKSILLYSVYSKVWRLKETDRDNAEMLVLDCTGFWLFCQLGYAKHPE